MLSVLLSSRGSTLVTTARRVNSTLFCPIFYISRFFSALSTKMAADDRPRPQTTNTVFMISPKYFGRNEGTAIDNAYQELLPEDLRNASQEEIIRLATNEFNGLVSMLKQHGVRVIVEEPLDEQKDCKDGVFPNNWISFHEGKIVVYPMKEPSRRRERRMDVVERLSRELSAQVVDYTSFEKEGKFLEGTGSMVLDRTHKICYSCLSQRTNPELLSQFCRDFDYKEITFQAFPPSQVEDPVYHTNIICSIGETFVVLCSSSIRDETQRKNVLDTIESTGKEVIDIGEKQTHDDFSGNCLQLRGGGGEKLLVMSTPAYESLTRDQLEVMERHVDRILHVPLRTIECVGGGGARCMLTEVFSSQ